MTGSWAIETENLTRWYGRTRALHGISLRVRPGERVAIFGSNGAGKSSLLRVLATLSRPTVGRAAVHGLDVGRDGNAIRQQIGLVAHQTFLYDDLTAEENLVFYGRMYGVAVLDATVEAALDRVGLRHRCRDRVRTFSRGMQQRLALARATLHHPSVLLLDEPDSGLDPQGAADLAHLAGLDAPGRTVLLATHHLELGLAHCERALILAGGRVVWEGAGDSLDTVSVRAAYRHFGQGAA